MSKSSKIGSKDLARSPEAECDARTWAEAQHIATGYRIQIERHDRLGFVGTALELPDVYADGETAQECYDATIEVLSLSVATMFEDGEEPPEGRAKRTFQVNIRLTGREKHFLSTKAKQMGFATLSDFIRTSTLDYASVKSENRR